MGALSGGGNLWGWNRPRRSKKPSESPARSSDSMEVNGGGGFRFPLKQAVTAGSLALTGDTIAQVTQRWRRRKESSDGGPSESEEIMKVLFLDHDLLRALRMTSYGFLLYGPGSYVWYQYLDKIMPQQTLQNLIVKVTLNQIVLGPCVIAVIFAWNNLWQRKVSQLPAKYRTEALPILLFGCRFWIPVTAINFSLIPLHSRVSFMSFGSIFWNFYLSSTMSKVIPLNSGCFHVARLHLLELLLVYNHEQVAALQNYTTILFKLGLGLLVCDFMLWLEFKFGQKKV